MLGECSIIGECNTEVTDMLFFLDGVPYLLRYDVSDCISLGALLVYLISSELIILLTICR